MLAGVKKSLMLVTALNPHIGYDNGQHRQEAHTRRHCAQASGRWGLVKAEKLRQVDQAGGNDSSGHVRCAFG
jgi:fumarate hydratase class II